MSRLIKFNSVVLIITVLAMSFSFCLTTQASENTSADDSYDAFAFLKAAGIVGYEAYEPDKAVTRAEFVKLALNAMNMHPGSDLRQIFSDVDVKSEYAPYINAAYDMRIISGSGASVFEPDSPLTLPAAVKILCGILGYSDLAELNGGFEAGYYSYASRYGVLDGFDTASFNADTALNMSHVMLLMLNAVNADVLEAGGYYDGIEIKNNQNTLLSLYFDIYEATGIVSANAYTTLLADESSLDKAQVEIDGVVYDCGASDIENYLGYELDFYYKTSDSMANPEIVWFESSENCYVTEVESDMLFSDNSNIRYEDEKGRLEDIKLDSVATFIYNGKMATMHYSDLADVNGKVIFVSNDGDKKADVVHVSDYEAMIVKGVSNSIPSGVSAGGEFMSLESDNDCVITIEKNGEAISLADIAIDNVLLIAKSNGEGLAKIHIIVSDTAVTGNVDMTDEDSVYVAGTEYDCDRNVYSNIRSGVTYRLLVDAFGKIQSAEKINDIVYGYLKGLATFGMDGAKCRIFTENNRWVELDLADKIRYNGQMLEQEKVMELLGTQPDSYRQLVRYTVNDNAEVNMIETAETVALDSDYEQQAIDEDAFRKIYSGTVIWRNPVSSLGGLYTADANTKVFTIPADLNDDGFAVKGKEVFQQDTNYTVTIFDTDSLLRAGVVVVENYQEAINVTGSFLIVDSVRNVMNRDGDSSIGIHGYWNGAKITIPVKTDETLTEASVRELAEGDIVQFSVNDKSEIIELIVHRPDSDGYYIKGNYYSVFTVAGGTIKATDASANLIRFIYQENTSGISALNSSTKIYIYDTETGNCQLAALSDVLPGDKFIAKMRYLVCNELIIIR